MPRKPSKKLSKLCETCGEVFYPRKDRYSKIRFCSKKCSDKGMSQKVEIKCKFCQKAILIKPSHVGKVSYCSKECMAEDYKSTLKGENNPNYKNAGIKYCKFCGKEFKSYTNTRKYCSSKCYHDDNKAPIKKCKRCDTVIKSNKIYCDLHKPKRKPKKEYFCKKCGAIVSKTKRYCSICTPHRKYKRVCIVCGKIMIVPKSGNTKFCSIKCTHEHYRGEGNPNYIDGRKSITSMIRESSKNRELIKKILERDDFTCQKCGQIGWELHVDHIKHFATIYSEFKSLHKGEKDKQVLFDYALEYPDFWDESNLRVLCKKCNLSRPKGKRDYNKK